ncbi:MAG: hypothetical protein ABWW65_05915 [Thermoprotei archaeon]
MKLSAIVNIGFGYDCVSFVRWSCSDLGPDPQSPGYSNSEYKDVGSCSIRVLEVDNRGNNIVLSLALTNTYPGYSVKTDIIVRNTGTVPVKLANYTIEPPGLPLDIYLELPSNTYMSPGEESMYSLYISVEQDADENTIYYFNVSLGFRPWNNIPPLRFTSWKAHAYAGEKSSKDCECIKCIKEEGLVSIRDNGVEAVVVFSEFNKGWGWIGLVISNEYDHSITLNKDQIMVQASRELNNAIVYLYGGFRNVGNSGVWRSIDICEMKENMNEQSNPFPSINSRDQVILGKNEKAIVWIYIESAEGSLEVTIRLNTRI